MYRPEARPDSGNGMEKCLKTPCTLKFELRTETHLQPGEKRHLELSSEKPWSGGQGELRPSCWVADMGHSPHSGTVGVQAHSSLPPQAQY